MALQLRRKTHESIVYIDSDSAPRIMPSGEDFILEDIPVGTRVLYPNPPMKGLPNREAAIRYALNHPLGCDPLFAQLEPGMKVTIAVDDISLPLPPMATPDIRQTMLEIVLDMLAGHGVDDVHIIIANSLHRKMTPWEMKRMVGQKIYDDFYPDRYSKLAKRGTRNLWSSIDALRRAIFLFTPTSTLCRWTGGINQLRSGYVITNRCARITSRKPFVIPTATWIRIVPSLVTSVGGSAKSSIKILMSSTSRRPLTIACTKATWIFC